MFREITNAQLAAVYTEARKRLWDGVSSLKGNKEEYICHAISSFHTRGRLDVKAKARRIIASRLDGLSSLESWLLSKHCIIYEDFDTLKLRLQQHRLAWLNMLIKEFSE